MFTVGGLATADAIATIAWQEPLSSLYTSHQQTELRRRLATLDAQPLIPAVKLPPSPAERMAKLAVALEHHATSGSPLGRVSMPSIHSSFVLVQGTGEASLKRGPGHYATTVLPGLRGTVGLAGHRTTYLAPFRRINELRKGARILLEMPYGRFEYRVSGTQIVKPTDTKALRPSHEDRLVLTACHPLYSAAERIVVTAELRTAEPRGAARRTV
jgi:sortase A